MKLPSSGRHLDKILWLGLALGVTGFCLIPTYADAKVTVKFSDDVNKEFKAAKKKTKGPLADLNKRINDGLEELSKTNADAKRLFDSGQTIKIVCFSSKEAKKLGMSTGDGFFKSPGETRGDFDAKGKPKKGGTAIIAIECEKLVKFGLDKKFLDIDPFSTGFRIIVHELLHASEKSHTHSADGLKVYNKFVLDFEKALENRKISFNPDATNPDREYVALRRPVSFQLITREPEVCVGTAVSVTLGEGFEELLVDRLLAMEAGEGSVTTVTESENPDPELLETPKKTTVETSQSEEVERTTTVVVAVPDERQDEPAPVNDPQGEVAPVANTEPPQDTPPDSQDPDKPEVEKPETEEPEDPPARDDQETDDESDLGLIKANVSVLLNPASAQAGTVIKLAPDIPPLPGTVELAELVDGELAELEDLGLEEIAELEDQPIGDLESELRSSDNYQSDQAGGVVESDGQLTLAANTELTDLIDDSVILEIAKRIRSGELEADPVKDRNIKSMIAKTIRTTKLAEDEIERRQKEIDADFEKFGRVGLDFRLKKWGPLIKPRPLTLDDPVGPFDPLDDDPNELGDGEFDTHGRQILPPSSRRPKKDDEAKAQGMGGTTDIQAPTRKQLEEFERQEREKRRRQAENEDPTSNDGEGQKTVPIPGTQDGAIQQLTATVQNIEADGTTTIQLDLRGANYEKTKPMIVALQASENRKLTTNELSNVGANLAAELGINPPARIFSVGTTPIFVFRLLESQHEEKRQLLQSNTLTSFVEDDPCRVKEEADPHFKGSGLWGQDFDNQWAIKRVGFNDQNEELFATDNAAEAPIVAVIDSGIDWFHPDLPKSTLWRNSKDVLGNGVDDDGNGYVDDTHGWNFIDNNNKPWDQDGHGTFVSGVIAAGQDNGVGIRGISSAVKIMPLKALDAFGQGHASMVSEAISYAVDNGAEIINLSLGGRQPTKLERLAIDHATASGVLVVAAAGNQGSPVADFAPASLPGVLTVAATDRRDRRARFSNWGPAVDLSAPGVDVLSLRARDTDLLSLIDGATYETGAGIVGDDRAYFRASGTSFAAPIVSGAAATLLAKNGDLNGIQLKRMLVNSARDIETSGIDNFSGYGLLDVAKAVTADPDYFINARLASVRVVKVKGKQALLIRGTASADKFEGASIFVGKGAKPAKWFRVKTPIKEPVLDDRLIVLPARIFAKAPRWTLRLDVKHQDGSKRSSQFDLKLR